jgi:hypothetical protein
MTPSNNFEFMLVLEDFSREAAISGSRSARVLLDVVEDQKRLAAAKGRAGTTA